MNGRSGMLLALAVLCGLGAMFGVRKLLIGNRQTARTREILAAARDLKVEEVLKPDMVKVVQVPEDRVPAGAFSSFQDVAERWVRLPMLAEDAIVEGKLAPKNAPVGMGARIPDGMRAYTVDVNEQSGVSGFILPDHRVDVVLAYTGNNRGSRPSSETILQDVLVLAAGQVTTRPEDKSIQVHTVTLALLPEQVDTLAAAKNEGSLTLSLRGLHDHKSVAVRHDPKPEETRPILVAAVALKPGQVIILRWSRSSACPKQRYFPRIRSRRENIVGRSPGWTMAPRASRSSSQARHDRRMASAVEPRRPNDLSNTAGMRAVPMRCDLLSGGIGLVHRGDLATLDDRPLPMRCHRRSTRDDEKDTRSAAAAVEATLETAGGCRGSQSGLQSERQSRRAEPSSTRRGRSSSSFSRRSGSGDALGFADQDRRRQQSR